MPKFTICLAHDVSYYGTTEVEAPTWEEAVRSLTDDGWWDVCRQRGDDSHDMRVVYVEDEEENEVAVDLAFSMQTVDTFYVLHRLRWIRQQPGWVQGSKIDAFIRELEAHGQDPVFKEQEA